jgi:formylmethanofuran dehydrogenase subunit E
MVTFLAKALQGTKQTNKQKPNKQKKRKETQTNKKQLKHEITPAKLLTPDSQLYQLYPASLIHMQSIDILGLRTCCSCFSEYTFLLVN